MTHSAPIDATKLSSQEIVRLAGLAVELIDQPRRGVGPVDPPFNLLGDLHNAIALDGPLVGTVQPVLPAMRPGHVQTLHAHPDAPGQDYRLLEQQSEFGREFRCWTYLNPSVPGADRRGAAKETRGALRQPYDGRKATRSIAPRRLDVLCTTCRDSYTSSDAPDTPQAEVAAQDWAVSHYLTTGHHDFEHHTVDRWTYHCHPEAPPLRL